MKKIVYQGNFAFIYLTKEFYNKTQIEAAISNYKDFIEHNTGELGKYFILKISLKTNDYALKILSEEILNYILSEQYQLKSQNQ